MNRERNSMEITVFGVLAASVARTVLHLEPLPVSLRATPLLGQGAATVLFIGCLISAGGILWRDRIDGLVIEQLGLALAGLGLLFYGTALTLQNPWNLVAFAAGMSFGLAAACLVRWVQIQRFVRGYRLRLRELSERRED